MSCNVSEFCRTGSHAGSFPHVPCSPSPSPRLLQRWRRHSQLALYPSRSMQVLLGCWGPTHNEGENTAALAALGP
eukprot:1001569-Pelagomonas_calceolata.AAC.2